MLITFYDCKGIAHMKFVPEGETVRGEYYSQVLHCLWSRIVRVRSEYPEEKHLFSLHDNAPPYNQKSQRIFDEKTDLCHRQPSVFALSSTV